MTYQEAYEAMRDGKKVKLSDWMGYWFMLPTPQHYSANEREKFITVFTKDGDILDTPYIPRYQDREDWEITDGKMGFDFAIRALKANKRVCRSGWNDQGMWLVIIHPGNAMHTSIAGAFPMLPCIGMKTATGDMCPGWLASQTDMLAEDWEVI